MSGGTDPVANWREYFLQAVQEPDTAAPLKEAAIAGRLGAWTTLLTSVVVKSCAAVGWRAAAKRFALDILPQIGQEYLGMDAMAFEDSEPVTTSESRWRFPVAVFELENSRRDDRVAYSLWKVLCVRAKLRVVFAYRDDWERARELIAKLTAEVIGRMTIDERTSLPGETLLVIGSRGEGETFPWGYFKLWRLDRNTGRFAKL